MRILILDSGNSSSYHVMRSLARAGHEPHLSSPEEAGWARSRYCAGAHRSPPPTDGAAFSRYLLDLTAAIHFDLLLFCGDHEAELIWELRDRLEPQVACFLPPREARAIAFSKLAACEHAARVEVPVPRTIAPADGNELVAAAEQVGLPAIVKGERGSAASRVRRARDLTELAACWAELLAIEAPEGGRPSVQELVPGRGYVVHALFRHGEPLALCAHRKEREYPTTGGVTSCAVTVRAPELEAAALRFLSSLRWHGLAKLDFLRDERDGRFKFIELDPRISASIDITRAAGVDQALLLCRLAAGEPVEPQLGFQGGVRYRWLFPRDVLAAMQAPHILPGFLLDFLRPSCHLDLGLEDPRAVAAGLRRLGSRVRRDVRRLRAVRGMVPAPV